jgi:hypothetical protein
MYSESYAGGYGFVKEITWEFYRDANATGQNAIGEPVGVKESDGRISFICNLVTNCAESATDVYVDNEYFVRGQDSFDNLDITNFVSIGTSTKVKIQQASGRYPQRIYNSGDNNGTINDVKVFINGVDTGKTITIDRDNVLQGITFEDYSDSGLDLTQELTFKFSDKYYVGGNNWSANAVEYVATCTLRDIRDGKTINFTAPAIKVYEIIIPTTQTVSVQQETFTYGWNNSVSVYPYKIHNVNNPKNSTTQNNNGTESVTVSVGGVDKKITIDKDNVTKGVTISIPAGVSPDATMIFTFSDRYCTGVNSDWGQLSGFNFSPNNTTYTYTFECTVEEFINGVTLNFTHQ